MESTLNLRELGDGEFRRLRERFKKYTGICPTCEGTGIYRLDGQELECDCDTQRKLQRHFYAANLGDLYHDISFDDFLGDRDDLIDFLRDYIEKFDQYYHYGTGITFSGPLGTGKSFAASVILKELIKRGHQGYFITFDDLLQLQRRGWDDISESEEFERIRTSEILVMDEVFATQMSQKQKDFLAESMERIIRFRTANRLPTILTTNLSFDEQVLAYPRIMSLLSQTQEWFEITGEDMRIEKVRARTKQLVDRGERRPIR
jgi:DNA replication protein DnaC